MSETFWAASVMVCRSRQGENESRHTIFMLRASSKDEAEGRAARVGRKVYPPADGWSAPHVMTCPANNVVDPDGPIVATPAD